MRTAIIVTFNAAGDVHSMTYRPDRGNAIADFKASALPEGFSAELWDSSKGLARSKGAAKPAAVVAPAPVPVVTPQANPVAAPDAQAKRRPGRPKKQPEPLAKDEATASNPDTAAPSGAGVSPAAPQPAPAVVTPPADSDCADEAQGGDDFEA